MSKIRYRFNRKTLNYERAVTSMRTHVFRVVSFLGTASVIGALAVVIAFKFFDSPKEKQLRRELEKMKLQYNLVNGRVENMNKVIEDLEHRDDNIYRVIFEAEPIPSDIRKAGFGGVDRYADLEGFDNSQLMLKLTQKVDRLAKEIYIQSKSFDEVIKMVDGKKQLLASIPAIMPISNKDLSHTPSGFGMRMHPIYKIAKMHSGMDFTSPSGTPIYATGDAIVELATGDGSGYGNHVILDHSYGYKTVYGHMSKILVIKGQKVLRGEKIGLVGSTGLSTGPHCHYEVIKNGQKINPVNYYFLDLSPQEYATIVSQSDRNNQSFD